ncbi:MAG: ABC transporter substrate-binding protein [Gloeomargarita sp. SKYG116]|nr:ABC transporter substrate-binding protein [Gloeomargarita sp. SKYG116]MDW8400413.1 ABC transporter substrate-binding protein [Gloeomargarita sp. SKYGB_i_bin116]
MRLWVRRGALALGILLASATVAWAQPYRRVVALTSLTADILHRLDGQRLVGVPGSSLLEKQPELARLPKVSEGRVQPNLERIVALKPDVVIGASLFHEPTANRLQSLGIATHLVDVRRWEDLEAVTRQLAQLTATNPDPLLRLFRSLNAPKPARAREVLVLVSERPILTPNRDSWAGSMLERFHLRNLAADLQGRSPIAGYVTLSPEQVLRLDPEVLIVVGGPGENPLPRWQSQSFWRRLKAVRQGEVYALDYYGLVNPGSVEAIRQAALRLQAIAQGRR